MINPEPAATPINSRGLAFTAGAALVLLVFVVYLPSLRGGFVWDDLLLVQQNPLVTGELSLRSIWFSTDFPLANVALWLEWLALGKPAVGYRIVNALLHAGSCVLLWRLLARLMIPGAWLAAALFAVHPVCVASVAWISEIKNTLSLPFYLASIWFFLVAEQKRDSGRLNYLLSLGAFLLALLTKTSTVMLPVVLLACAGWRRGRIGKSDLLKTAPHFLLALVFGLLTVWFQTQQTLAGFTLPPESFASRLAGAGMAFWFYLGKALLPLQLNAIYPRWEIDPRMGAAYLPLLLLVAVAGMCWWFRRSWGRPALFALGCFAVSLFPVLGFFDMYFLVFSRVSDHFQYLALIAPLAWLAAALLVNPWNRPQSSEQISGGAERFSLSPAEGERAGVRGQSGASVGRFHVQRLHPTPHPDPLPFRRGEGNDGRKAVHPTHSSVSSLAGRLIPRAVGVVLLAGLGLLTAQRAKVYATDEALWRDTLAKNPAAWNAHNNLGCILAEQNDLAGATKHFLASLKLNPRNVSAHVNLGRALLLKNNFPEAETHFRTALEIKPDHVDTLIAYGGALAEQRRPVEAVKRLRAALRLKPDPDTRLQLAPLLSGLGKDAEAVTELRAVLVVQPDSSAALQNLAWILATSFDEKIRNGVEAVRIAERAGELSAGKDAQMLAALAAAYAETDRFAEAVTTAQKAIEVARADGNGEFAQVNAQLQRLYRAGKPYHSPPPPAQQNW